MAAGGEDLYLVLGVQRSADRKQVRAAYLRLAKLHHPDRGGSEERFQQIQEAYRVLTDVGERAAYDAAGDRSTWVAQRSTDDDDFREHLRKQREFAGQFGSSGAKFAGHNVDEWERAHGLGKYADNRMPEDLRQYYVSIKKAEAEEQLRQEAKKMSKHQQFAIRQKQRDRIAKIHNLMNKNHERKSLHTMVPNRTSLMSRASLWLRRLR